MKRQAKLLLGALAGAVLSYPAVAQNPQPAPPQEPHHPLAPPSAAQPPPEQIVPQHVAPDPRSAQNDGTLSDRLSRRQGTLQPPSVDPGISAPLPTHGQSTMPVIPPPGSPGGNQSVVPK
jgi:hypothetical protein